MMKILINISAWRIVVIIITLLFTTSHLFAATYYVRTDGGTYSQCTGLVDVAYDGSGTGEPCSWKHPFDALPPGGTARISGGDTLIIGNGSFRMGYTAGVYDTGACSSSWTWDCVAPALPAGTSGLPTKVLGKGWDNGCTNPPELYGTEGANSVLNASNDYIEIQCLNITDHDQCINSHGATGPSEGKIPCTTTFPKGERATNGLIINGADNLLLKDLEIHGLSSHGIYTATSGGSNWTLDNVNVHHNGWAGWDGGGYSGSMIIKNSSINYNGCGETYPGGETIGCWGQSAGGYGDGMGMTSTSGNWNIMDTEFKYNTSDGLDLLYLGASGTASLTRIYAEGNAGNQLKVSGGDKTIVNTVAIGNCGYFEGKSFDYAVDDCRALGHPIALGMPTGSTADLVNVSVYSEGDGIFTIGGSSCDGTEKVTMRNIAAIGDTDYHQTFENSAYIWSECKGVTIDHDYEYIYNTKNKMQISSSQPFTEIKGTHNVYADPQFFQASTASESFDLKLKPTSPAINSGLPGGTTVGILQVPTIDYFKASRTLVDIGAIEYGLSLPYPFITIMSDKTYTPK